MWLTVLIFGCEDKALDTTGGLDTSIEEREEQSAENKLSFASDVLPLFTEASCENCHGEMVISYDILMSSMAGDFDADVNACVLMPWVTPFEPERSFLQHKLDGTFIEFGFGEGEIMPLLPGEEDIVRQWILDGALP